MLVDREERGAAENDKVRRGRGTIEAPWSSQATAGQAFGEGFVLGTEHWIRRYAGPPVAWTVVIAQAIRG